MQEIPNGIAAWAGTMVVPQQVLSRCGVRNTCVLGQHEKMERHDPCVHRSATGASSIYLGRWLPIQWAIWEAHCCSYWPCLGSPDVQCRMLLAAILPQRGSSISLLVGIYIILFLLFIFGWFPKHFFLDIYVQATAFSDARCSPLDFLPSMPSWSQLPAKKVVIYHLNPKYQPWKYQKKTTYLKFKVSNFSLISSLVPTIPCISLCWRLPKAWSTCGTACIYPDHLGEGLCRPW